MQIDDIVKKFIKFSFFHFQTFTFSFKIIHILQYRTLLCMWHLKMLVNMQWSECEYTMKRILLHDYSIKTKVKLACIWSKTKHISLKWWIKILKNSLAKVPKYLLIYYVWIIKFYMVKSNTKTQEHLCFIIKN